jgi:hypothetical protein
MAAKRLSGISFNTVFFNIVSGKIKEETPRIKKMLKILLPITFPIAISEFPVYAAYVLTINSGADVPNATTVKPITIFGIPYFFAKDDAPSTRRLAP